MAQELWGTLAGRFNLSEHVVLCPRLQQPPPPPSPLPHPNLQFKAAVHLPRALGWMIAVVLFGVLFFIYFLYSVFSSKIFSELIGGWVTGRAFETCANSPSWKDLEISCRALYLQ